MNIRKMPKMYHRCTPDQSRSSKSCFNKSAVTNHIAKANHVIDWEGENVADRENIQRIRCSVIQDSEEISIL